MPFQTRILQYKYMYVLYVGTRRQQNRNFNTFVQSGVNNAFFTIFLFLFPFALQESNENPSSVIVARPEVMGQWVANG